MIDASVDPIDRGPGLLETMWRHRTLVVVAAVIGGLLGYYLSSLQPTTYQAQAEVVLLDASTISGVFENGLREPDAERRLLKEADRMASRPVLAAASEALGLGGDAAARHLEDAIDVSGAVEQDLITVTATAAGPTLAASRANAVAEAYEEMMSAQAVEEAAVAAAEIQAAKGPIEARLEDLQAALAADDEDISAQIQQSAAINELTDLEAAARELAVNATLYGSGIEYIEPALVPEEPISPAPLRDGILLAVLAVAAAAAYAWWQEGRSSVAETANDPASVLAVPLLGQVPDFGPSGIRALFDSSGSPPLLSDPRVEENGSEAYHFIATSLEFALGDASLSTVVFTSATPDEGKTITVLNTALAAAGDGRKVVVVDADGRKRSLTRLAGLEPAPGFSDLVTGGADLSECLHTVAFGAYQVTIMPAGAPVPNPAGFFRSQRMHGALQQLKSHADLVIIDSPAALAVADTVALAAHADAIALVVNRNAGFTPLESMRDRLRMAGTPVIGYVFNRATQPDVPYEYYSAGSDERATHTSVQQATDANPNARHRDGSPRSSLPVGEHSSGGDRPKSRT